MLQRFTQARYPNYQGILRFLKYGTERKAQPIVHPRESLIANSSVRVKAGGKWRGRSMEGGEVKETEMGLVEYIQTKKARKH